MKGARLVDAFDQLEAFGFGSRMPLGSYGRTERGVWECCTPNGRLGNLSSHDVTEHEDGTITVAPSILVHGIDGRSYDADERARLVAMHGEAYVESWERGRPAWHGYLERGIWRAV